MSQSSMWTNGFTGTVPQNQDGRPNNDSSDSHANSSGYRSAHDMSTTSFADYSMSSSTQELNGSSVSALADTDMSGAGHDMYHLNWDTLPPAGNHMALYPDPGQLPSSYGPVAHINAIKTQQNPLPSPQSTTISTPDMTQYYVGNHYQDTLRPSPQFVGSSQAAFNFTPETSTDYQSHMSQLTSPLQSSHPMMTSPAIQISRFSRGDSPARSDHTQGRPRKRSASSLSQNEFLELIPAEATDPHLLPPLDGANADWTVDNDREGQAPSNWDSTEIMSLQDIAQHQETDRRLSLVQQWFERTSLEPGAERRARTRNDRPDRLRSRSTGIRPHVAPPILNHSLVPGPGLVVDEESDYHYSTDTESQISFEQPPTQSTDLPTAVDPNDTARPEEPLPSQFIFTRPWRDAPVTNPTGGSVRFQPDSSQAAMSKYMARAREFDSASRRATWGTGRFRRSSEGDLATLPGEKTRHLSLIKPTLRDRGVSIVAKARESVLKRSNSRSKPPQGSIQPGSERVHSPEAIDERASNQSHYPFAPLHHSRSKSPSIGAALLGAGGQMAAIGGGSASMNMDHEVHHEGFLRKAIRRVRSKSDVNRSPGSPAALTDVRPHLSSNSLPQWKPTSLKPQDTTQSSTTMDDTTNVESETSPMPVKVPLNPRSANVMPDMQGFKVQISELSPMLAPYLTDRMAHDQVRRYKRLVKNKVDHAGAMSSGKCKSGNLCAALAGVAELRGSSNSSGDTSTSVSALFKITSGPDSDDDDLAFDGTVAPAAFPEGIPLPPVKQLPARFECPLCFEVKTFQKPSDWTKHVHEDVQPFTCTFPDCPEPRSFKRKADWVRHENERHRHLEWWECSWPDCPHVCYRKDNFVQHLVREHKCKEPTTKVRANGNSKGKGKPLNAEEQAFWTIVDTCRRDVNSDSRVEPCKFCGNICTSWKKLSVHVGKHMEQIALPVLELAQKRRVNKDTIISPVAPLPPDSTLLSSKYGLVGRSEPIAQTLSPYLQSHQTSLMNSSAEHSPAGAMSYRASNDRYTANIVNGNNYGTTTFSQDMQQPAITYEDLDYSLTNIPTEADLHSISQQIPLWQQTPHYDHPHQSMPANTTHFMPESDLDYGDSSQYFSSPELQQQAMFSSNAGFHQTSNMHNVIQNHRNGT